MSAGLLQFISNRWQRKQLGEISDSQYAGDHVFYPTMEALNKAKVKPQTIAWQTASGFWVRKEDHI